MASHKQLLKDLEEAQAALQKAREAIIEEIRTRLDEANVPPSRFAEATGLNKGNLYNMLRRNDGKWNTHVAVQALDMLTTVIRDANLNGR